MKITRRKLKRLIQEVLSEKDRFIREDADVDVDADSDTDTDTDTDFNTDTGQSVDTHVDLDDTGWADYDPSPQPITRFWTDPVVGTGFNIGYDPQTLKRKSRGGGVERDDPDAHQGTYLFVVDPADRARDEDGDPLEPIAALQNREYHQGQDIFAPRGAEVPAYIDGWIHRIGMERGAGGNVVTISTAPRNEDGRYPEGTEFVRYAHLDSVASDVEAGDYVFAGTIIGTVGDTGSARGTAPHIHLSVSVADSRGQFNWGSRYHKDPYDLFDQSGWLTDPGSLYLSESEIYSAVRNLFESVEKV